MMRYSEGNKWVKLLLSPRRITVLNEPNINIDLFSSPPQQGRGLYPTSRHLEVISNLQIELNNVP
jgi:hypothetical protein